MHRSRRQRFFALGQEEPLDGAIDPVVADFVQAAGPGVEAEDDQEENALENLDAGAGELELELEEIAAARDAAEEDGDGDDGQRALAGDEGDEDACLTP